MIKTTLFALVFSTLIILPLQSQTQVNREHLTRILFIFDCSQSMAGLWQNEKKINVAREFLYQTIDSLEKIPNVQMALRVYGHQSPVPPQDCSDTKLEVPFSPKNGKNIKHLMRYLIPKGTTPIAYSLEQAGNDFPECDNCRNIIILITDGIEACEGDPCEISKTLNKTTAQVNLLDSFGYPSETNINMTFYDLNSGRIMYNFIHAINHRGNPDTLYLDPMIRYKMVVHSIPPVTLDSIRLNQGKHNIIAIDVPQGNLIIKPPNGNQFRNLDFLVRKAGQKSTLNNQKVNYSEKYLIGKYDIEIPTLPRLLINDVVVSQSETTTIQIPRPGIITLNFGTEGYCGLFLEKKNNLEWIYNIDTKNKVTNLVLLPGNYRVIFKPRSAKSVYYTIDKSFAIEPGKSGTLRIL